MSSTTPITIQVSPATRAKLDRIAADTRRSQSDLAADAVSAYVDRELEIIEGVKRGMADAEAGRVAFHDEAMAEIYAAIDAAEAKRKAKA